MAHEEYLRRNLTLASAQGAAAGIRKALARLEGTTSPKWLRQMLQGSLERSENAVEGLIEWRDAAPDRPE